MNKSWTAAAAAALTLAAGCAANDGARVERI